MFFSVFMSTYFCPCRVFRVTLDHGVRLGPVALKVTRGHKVQSALRVLQVTQ